MRTAAMTATGSRRDPRAPTSRPGNLSQRRPATTTGRGSGQRLVYDRATTNGFTGDAKSPGNDTPNRLSGLRVNGQRFLTHTLDNFEALRRSAVGGDGFIDISWHRHYPALANVCSIVIVINSVVSHNGDLLSCPRELAHLV